VTLAGEIMKFIILCLLIFSTLAMADVQSVKFEKGIQLKFNDKEWKYQYVKALSIVTPHLFENISNKDLKVIVQKETHADKVGDKKTFIENKCKDANKFYQNSKQGSAKSLQIKDKEVCFITMNKKDKNSYQIVYPIQFNKDSYELISFAWNDGDEKYLQSVSGLVGDNL
jgi:hypothetical protein